MRVQKRKTIKHYNEIGHVHELTFSCYRQLPLLTSDHTRRLLCQSIERAIIRHRFQLFSFVLMPEHVHLLVHPQQAESKVENLLYAIKRPFSYRIKTILKQQNNPLLKKLTIRQRPGRMTFRFWQEGPGFDRNMTESATIVHAINYIHRNPVRRKICKRAIDWKWSSARFYLDPDFRYDPDLPNVTRIPFDILD